jgi:hypothetical protein
MLLAEREETIAGLESPRTANQAPRPPANVDAVSIPEQVGGAALRRIAEAEFAASGSGRSRQRVRRHPLLVGLVGAVAAAAAVVGMRPGAVPERGTSPSVAVSAVEADLSTLSAGLESRRLQAQAGDGLPAGAGAVDKAVGRLAKAPTADGESSRVRVARARTRPTPRVRSRTAVSTPPPRTVVWTPLPGATSYHVELFRGRQRIFVTDSTPNRVTIPASWDLGGRIHRLGPGDRLHVWAVLSDGRTSGALVDGELVVDLP